MAFIPYMRKKAAPSVEQSVTTEQTGTTKKGRSIDIPWLKVFLIVALVSTSIGSISATRILATTEKKIADAKEMARPAKIQLTKINASGCQDCFNLDDAVAMFKKQNITVESEKSLTSDSPDAEKLIKDLGIKRLPTYLVTGEVSKKSLEGFVKSNGEMKNNTFVFTGVQPLFIDTESKREVGQVSVTYLTDPACPQCINPKLTVEAYKKAGIKITNERDVPWNSTEGQKIVNQYKITKLPTFLLSSDIDVYPSVKSNWNNLGSVESDGVYVARQLFLPYRDLSKGQVVGLVDVLYMSDSSCPDCYKPQEVHKNILTQGFGVGIRSERTVDANSTDGRTLVSKYAIKQVPTLLLSPEVGEYSNIKQVWPQVGTTESDGWYVFRKVSTLGNLIYKDLEKNEIVRPQTQAPSAAPTQ